MFVKRPWLWLLLVPIAIHWPDLTGWLSENPLYLEAGLTRDWRPNGVLPGQPGWIDGNAGVTLQALGHLVAHDWKTGIIPWWNPYSGLGMPLAGEMQPAAFFLPFVLLLGVSGGVLILKITLQIVAGLAMWGLLRQLGLCRAAALTGAMLFELNGSFAWDSDSSSLPIAFLPLFLLGIERALAAAQNRRPGGWVLMSVAMAYSIVAGFPETAYINGLLALAWAGLRLVQAHGARIGFAARLACGGVVALLLCAPLLLAFASFLGESAQGMRGLGHAALQRGDFAMFLFPYLYGPIFFNDQLDMWYRIGGYVGVPVLFLAFIALAGAVRGDVPARGLRCLLAGWIMLSLAKAGGALGITDAWNMIPFISETLFYRYAPASWECAAIILAAFAVNDVWAKPAPRRRVLTAGFLCMALCLAALVVGRPVWRDLGSVAGGRVWFYAAVLWGLSCTCIIALACMVPRKRAILLGALSLDAGLQFSVPLLAGSRGGAQDIDLATVQFLQQNLRLSRVYTTGPLVPNFGAFYGIAEINHIYAPVPANWVTYLRAYLDPHANPVIFNGRTPAPEQGVETRLEALRRRVPAYAGLGVKYVLAWAGKNPFAVAPSATDPETTAAASPRLVFQGKRVDVYELPNPAPYFDAPGCALTGITRERVHARCSANAYLVRRELSFPGWRAQVNRVEIPIAADGIFQKIALPAGESDVQFSFAPPYAGWGFAGTAFALCVLAWQTLRARSRWFQRLAAIYLSNYTSKAADGPTDI